MEGIRFISKNMVQPEKIVGELFDRIELTSWDIKCLLLGPIQKGLFFPKPSPLQEKELFGNDVVEHLKKSFNRVLEFFYPLCGRLCAVLNQDDDTSSFFIDCNNKGADFIHALVENTTVKDILEPIYTPRIVQLFFPMNGILNIEGDSNPLLAVQVNELVDGFFIGCTMNHSVGDGSSFWHFLNSWSEISRGFDTISKSPVFERWFPSEIDSPLRIPLSACSVTNGEFKLPLIEERVFHFPKENIEKLKARANLEMNTTNISSLQALLAHLWQSIIRCQKIDFDIEVIYVLVVGARPRLQSLMQQNYFGNAILGAPLSTKAGVLVNQSLGSIASQMHQVIALHTGDVLVNNFIERTKSPKLATMGVLTNKALLTSSSPRFTVYVTDFGWGKPVAVRSGLANKCDGKITLFPGVEKGSIDIEVCLSPEKLNALENDVEFTEAVAMAN